MKDVLAAARARWAGSFLSATAAPGLAMDLFRLAILGFAVFFPSHDFMPYLSTGRHGHELYAAWRVLEGAVPYKDFQWDLGPLAAWYYAGCMKLWSVSVRSMLPGQIAVLFAGGAAVFLALRRFLPLTASYAGTAWFWLLGWDATPSFAQGLAMAAFAGLWWVHIERIHRPRTRVVWAAPALALWGILSDPLAGGAASAALAAATLLEMRRGGPAPDRRVAAAYLAACAAAALVYFILLLGVPSYRVTQCFFLSFTGGERSGVLEAILQLTRQLLHGGEGQTSAGGVFASAWWLVPACVLGAVLSATTQKPDHFFEGKLRSVWTSLAVFTLASLAEFFFRGHPQSIQRAVPLVMLSLFVFLALAWRRMPRRWAAASFLAVAAALALTAADRYALRNACRTPKHLIHFDRGQVHLRAQLPLVETIHNSTIYIQHFHAIGNETMAFAYLPFYHFLSGKVSPVWEVSFLANMRMTPEQERAIIDAIEAKKVNFTILSDQGISADPDRGRFGDTHNRILWQHIVQNFEPAIEIGRWSAPRESSWDHSIRIYRRKGLQPPAGT